MASKNLEQGIQAIQQKDLGQGRRLLRIALNNDPLSRQERVNARLWLAETDDDPQYKIEQYREALQLDPTNQDVVGRLNYWIQLTQPPTNPPPQANPPAQGNQQQNWTQQQPGQSFPQQGNQPFQQQNDLNLRPEWGQNSPTQGNPPVQGNQQQNWGQRGTQSFPQQNDLNLRPDWQQNSPSQGLPPVQGNQQQNWGQQQFNQPFVSQNDLNIRSDGTSQMLPQGQGYQHNWRQTQPNFNQGFDQQLSTQNFPPVPDQFSTGQFRAFQEQPLQLSQVQRTVGIQGGSNGAGTGFFVTRDGLIATTRHITGGERQLGVQLLDGRQIVGHVVRSFPAYDLSLLQVNVQLAHLIQVSQSPAIPDNMPIVAVTHTGEGIRSAKRSSDNKIDSHWFPTLINHLKDAGGNPVFDGNQMLVGMMTNNASRSNVYMYGLHIHKIYEFIDRYIHEKGQLDGQNTLYCNSCGVISRAPSFGGYFCETCGNTHPYAVDIKRYPQSNLAALYGDDQRQPCPDCSSRAGFYNRACLRCGFRL